MDDLFLSFGGTTVNVGSFLRADPGVDYGTKDLLQRVYTENAVAEGGRLAYERANLRRIQIPLVLASGGAGLSLTGLESLLRLLSQPGAVLDVKVNGVATADAVRFDVAGGRYEEEHHVRHQEIGVRFGTLKLETQPWAYLPTWIILASAASVGLPGQITLPNASLFGDIPGFLAITAQGTVRSMASMSPGTWLLDVLAWGLGKPSFQAVLGGGSWQSAWSGATYQNDAVYAPIQATTLRLLTNDEKFGPTSLAYYDITEGLEPAYRGRHRVFAFLNQNAQTAVRARLYSIDAVPLLAPSAPFASAAYIASHQFAPSYGFPAYLLDLGEITIPPVASGVAGGVRLRLWSHAPTSPQGQGEWLNAICLIPADETGLQAGGIAWPDFRQGSIGRFHIDGHTRTVLIGIATGQLASVLPVADGLRQYRGGFPQITDEAILALVGGARRTQNPTAYRQVVLNDDVSMYYRLEETNGPTVIDLSGNSRHGSYVGGASLGLPGAFAPAIANSAWLNINTPGWFAGASSNAARPGAGTNDWTFEFWARRGSVGIANFQTIVNHGTTEASFQQLSIGFAGSGPNLDKPAIDFFGDALYGPSAITDSDWHHYIYTYDDSARLRNILVDGVLVASDAAATRYQGALPQIYYGAKYNGNNPFAGGLDEVAFYTSVVLNVDQARLHYESGAGATHLIARPGQMDAAVSVLYRPRFAFLKGEI